MTLAFFRRHRKWFMVLMVAAVVSMMFFQAWIYMGPRISQMLSGGSAGPLYGTIQNRPINEEEVQSFSLRMRTAGRFTETLYRYLYVTATSQEARMLGTRVTIDSSVWRWARPSFVASDEKLKTLNVMVWLALYNEARAAGFDTSEAQVNERIAAMESLGVKPADIDELIGSLVGNRKDLFVESMRTDMTIMAYVGWLNEAMAGAVTPELRKEFVKNDDRLQALMVVFKASDFLADVKDVPQADLEKQFKDYRGVFAGQSKEGYGYRIPDKISLEYLVADAKGFEAQAAVKVTDKMIADYYEANKDREFLIEPAVTGTSATPAGTAPASTGTAAPTATTPAVTPTPAASPVNTFTSAPTATPAATATAATTATGPRGDAGVKGATTPTPAATPTAPAATPTATPTAPAAPVATPTTLPAPSPTSPLGFLLPPARKYRPLAEVKDQIRKTLVHAAATQMAAEEMRKDVVEIGRLTKPSLAIWADGKRVRLVSPTGFWSETQLKDKDFGKAMLLQQGAEPETLAEDALLAKELGVAKPRLGVNEISDLYMGEDGNVYAFRVTAVQVNHAPASVDEVRDLVLADCKKIKAMDVAREKAKALLEEAEKKGLEAAAKEAGVKVIDSGWFPQQILLPIPFGGRFLPQPPVLPELGSDVTVVEECFRLQAEGKKFARVTLADQQQALVIQVIGHKEPREAVFQQQRSTLAQDVTLDLAGACMQKALSLDDIVARNAIKVDSKFETFRVSQQGQKRAPIDEE